MLRELDTDEMNEVSGGYWAGLFPTRYFPVSDPSLPNPTPGIIIPPRDFPMSDPTLPPGYTLPTATPAPPSGGGGFGGGSSGGGLGAASLGGFSYGGGGTSARAQVFVDHFAN